jgi:aspartate aminotransferase-like enzyme
MDDVSPPPRVKELDDLLPKEPLLLMGAGPVPIPKVVANANGVVINHIGETMGEVITGLKEMAKYVFQTASDQILGVAGPASATMEMAITNLVWPGRKVLVLTNGTFGSRWAEIAGRVGGEVTVIEGRGILPVSARLTREAFEKTDYDVLIVTHGETSAGTITVELEDIAAVAKKNGAIIIVDAVTTIGVMPVFTDKWGLDVVVSGGQKGLGSIPGVSLVSFSQEAWQQIEKRTAAMPHWCLDARLAWKFWGEEHGYHYTAPVPGVLALYAALELIKDESLPIRWERHFVASKALQKSLEAMGLKLFVPEEYRLNSVVAINVPDGIDATKLRKHMVKHFGVEIAGAFGHNIVRIGQMGEQCRAQNLFKTVYALGIACRYYGAQADVARAMSVLEENLSIDPETFVV